VSQLLLSMIVDLFMIKNAGEGFVFAVEILWRLFAYSVYSFDTLMSSVVLYSETGKFLQNVLNF